LQMSEDWDFDPAIGILTRRLSCGNNADRKSFTRRRAEPFAYRLHHTSASAGQQVKTRLGNPSTDLTRTAPLCFGQFITGPDHRNDPASIWLSCGFHGTSRPLRRRVAAMAVTRPGCPTVSRTP